MDSVFNTLNRINVNEHTETKNGLTYLSWAWAWAEVKKAFPEATYTVYENRDGWNYFTDGRTCWVKTGVTIGTLEHIEYLPVMDFKNRSIELEKVTSFDVNKAIQRSLTKACARHGLGLYIYSGEDLPEGEEKPNSEPVKPTKKAEAKTEDYALKKIEANHLATILNLCNEKKVEPSKLLKTYGLNDLKDMNIAQFENAVKRSKNTK